MKFTIDIDTGGTFTDGYISGDGRSERVKVDTTPHDLTIGFFNLIEEASEKLGFENVRGLLRETDVIRFSTTVGTNALLQKSGPKLGLLVSRGFEGSVYSESGVQNPIFDYVLPRDMVIGIKGKVDASGNTAEGLDEDEIRRAAKELLVRGARVIVVSLANSPLNPDFEKRIKEIIEIDYPKHYLGSVPILLSTDISVTRDDAARTNAVLLDAYMHREMIRFLYKADEELTKSGYPSPLLIIHNWGGAARVAKTKAISTYNSGPVAGLFGAAYISGLYSIPNLVSIDIGGTSTDFGAVMSGRLPLKFDLDIGGLPTRLAIVETTSLAAGGGSIAKIEENEVKVGPESAGAMPGPVCYDLGGTEPTTTDACVVLGYINPDYFLGGKKKLDANKAYEAVERLALPLKQKVEEVAFKIVKKQESLCSGALVAFLNQKKLNGKDSVLLSYGGAGGIYSCGIAQTAGIPKIYMPPFAAVFSAFGSSTMDIAHEYEALLMLTLRDKSGQYLTSLNSINQKVEELEKIAMRDMKSEGLTSERINFNLEVELTSSGPNFTTRLLSPNMRIRSEKEVRALCDELERIYGGRLGEVVLEALKVRASFPVAHPQLPTYTFAGKSPEAALKGKKRVYWSGGFKETAVYEQRLLRCGNIVTGPAVIEGEDTTILVSDGMKYSMDKHLFGIIEKV